MMKIFGNFQISLMENVHPNKLLIPHHFSQLPIAPGCSGYCHQLACSRIFSNFLHPWAEEVAGFFSV